MRTWLKAKFRSLIEIATSLVPWVASMYVFFWLEQSRIWTFETPHRGKLSVILMGAGMLLSFVIYAYLAGRRRK